MKKLSKILSVSLSVVLTMVFVHLGTPVSNAATSYTEGYYTYTVTNGEATITDVDTSISGEITIPSTLGGYPVTSIGALAFFNCSSITSATISDSVTAIGGRAFADCNNLATIKYNGTKDNWNKIDIGSGFPCEINIIYLKENGWKMENGIWYYYADGVKKTGWLQLGNTWYYLNSDGSMQTGWLKLGDTWYYLTSSGAMATGWVKDGNTYYYFNQSGAMVTGWLQDGGSWYYLKDNGAMQTGWLELDGARYYFDQSGAMQIGWVVIDGIKYLFDNDGKCVEGAHSFVIDISKWQGNIDWDKLKATNIDAVILRSSYGGETAEDYNNAKDSSFAKYIENLNRLEIPYGTYHFNTAATVEIAEIQAQNVIRILKESGANPTYPVFVDIETNGGDCDLIAIAKVYMEVFIENGYKPGIYANQYYWENYLNAPEFNAYYKWISNYGIDNGYPSATFAPKDGIENYAIWQYTSVGIIDGITENTTDFNALFDWYEKPDGWTEISGKKFLYENGYVKFGWVRENGNLIYLKPSGEMAIGWLKIDETWYYFDNNGVMQTGWLKLGDTWYYLKDSGAMATGWLKLGDTWYYLSPGGAMQTGWLKLGNTWYYLTSSGAMATGWLQDGGSWYYLSPGGAMQTGWLKLGSAWYYLTSSGAMATGWLKLGNTWYYLKDSGAMATGILNIGGKTYKFSSSGAWIA